MSAEEFDVVIVGAGLSGIGAGYRLQTECPGKTYAILEGRAASGGTWDLFRFPGVRSDSDMFTLAYPFRPWQGDRSIAEGASILEYIRDTAEEYGVARRVRFQQQALGASWNSREARWTVEAQTGSKELKQYRCRFLYLCTGYYKYENGYTPEFAGRDLFQGQIVHPQSWPDDLDYEGKRVVVIGSGATAVTMVPALSRRAAHVTMLQRSPSYVASLPAVDGSTVKLRQAIPEPWANRLVRWRNVLLVTGFYQLCRLRPEQAKRMLRSAAARQLPPGYPVDPDFTPRYNPWDQRMCMAPDGDLFHAIKAGRASIVTDRIDTFTPDGIRLQSGRELDADIIVTATGLQLLPCGGLRLKVDEVPIEPSNTRIYRGFMLSDVPNMAICIGYINASWTLRADLTSRSVCRLINLMDRRGQVQAVPRYRGLSGSDRPLLDLSSGYVQRGARIMPKQGRGGPWRLRQNYLLDWVSARLGDMTRGLELSGPVAGSR